MKLNKIIEILSKNFKINLEDNSIYNLSTYISILYAFLSRDVHPNDVHNHFYLLLANRYNKLVSVFETIHNIIDKTDEAKICLLLQAAMNTNEYSVEFVISDFYQQIKTHLLQISIKTQNASIDKIQGKKMLLQTQFFTDSYMVDFLVEHTFSLYDDIDNILFVDPASGGGNFLTYLFHRIYEWYKSNKYEGNISELIFKNNLLGYDLDSDLAEFASLSLFLLACKTTDDLSNCTIFNYGGIENDKLGYLASNIMSNKIGNKSFSEVLENAKTNGKKIVYITNPPFMGKRDMDIDVKNYLKQKFPIAKGDLCVSFLAKFMKEMNIGDSIAVVSQNGWMNLTTLKSFRKYILENVHLNMCIDLGSNAFRNINGEKTNVVLSVFQKKIKNTTPCKSFFVNLRNNSLRTKMNLLSDKSFSPYIINTNVFLKNNSYEFNYQFGEDISIISKYKEYGDFAKCMQGSSTGDNNKMVKYIWQTNDQNWRLASKGGGFSKWEGLNYYKVKWGNKGELIKENKGGVLRNPSLMDETSLVFSDTGTLGLNVRQKISNQVFIASGPGIKIISGDKLCHMAFLNSRIASFFMKIINPKFTISGGYIQKLPVAKNILNNNEIKALSLMCLELKKAYLKNKLPNYEFTHYNYSIIDDVDLFLSNIFLYDMLNFYQRFLYEQIIDKIILEKYRLPSRLKMEYLDNMSNIGLKDYSSNLDLSALDEALYKMLSYNCVPNTKRIDGKLIGSENCLEILSYMFNISPNQIICTIYNYPQYFKKSLKAYKEDFIHKIILKSLCIDNLCKVGKQISISCDSLCDKIKKAYPNIYSQLALSEEQIREIVSVLHTKVFFNTPIVIIK